MEVCLYAGPLTSALMAVVCPLTPAAWCIDGLAGGYWWFLLEIFISVFDLLAGIWIGIFDFTLYQFLFHPTEILYPTTNRSVGEEMTYADCKAVKHDRFILEMGRIFLIIAICVIGTAISWEDKRREKREHVE